MVGNNPRGRAEGKDFEITQALLSVLVPNVVPSNATDGAVTETLPSLSTIWEGTQYIFKKSDPSSNSVTVVAVGVDRFDDGFAERAITVKGETVHVIASGGVWQVLGQGGTGGSGSVGGSPSLRFTTSPPATTVNVPTSTITVERLTGQGLPDSANVLVLGLSTSGSAVYLDSTGTTQISSVTIPIGSTSASFTFRSPTAGSYPVTVTANGYAPITQQIPVAAGAAFPTKLVFVSSPQTLTNSVISAAMTVELQDADDVPVATETDRTISLSSDSAGDTFYELDGTTVITEKDMTAGTSSISFLYKDTVNGTPTITAADASGAATVTLESSPILADADDTVAAGSNGVNTSTFAGAGTLNVASTTGFASTGTLRIKTGATAATVTYTGIGATTFTGCTSIGNNVAMATGDKVTGTKITTASFTPDAGTFLVARLGSNAYPEHVTFELADSVTTLTWIELAGQNGTSSPGRTAVWGAYCPTSQAMTVTATRTLTTYAHHGFALKVDVLSGTESGWGGASATGTATANDPTVSLTSTRASSRLIHVAANQAGNAITPNANMTETDEHNIASSFDAEFAHWTATPSVGTFQLGGTQTSAGWMIAAVELRAGAGTITDATQEQAVAAATDTGGVANTANQQLSAGDIMWHEGATAMYWSADCLAGTNAKGPQINGGNLVLRSNQIVIGYLFGFGGAEDLSIVGGGTYSNGSPDVQRQLINSSFVANNKTRASTRGSTLTMGCYLHDNFGLNKNIAIAGDSKRWGPAIDFFDATRCALFAQRVGEMAACAKRLGFNGGIFFDDEADGHGLSWNWDYNGTGTSGATATEAQRRAAARALGVQVGAAIKANYPGCQVSFYAGRDIPGGAGGPEQVNAGNDTEPNEYRYAERQMVWNFFDGVYDATNIAGLGNFNPHDASFYRRTSAFVDIDTMYWYHMNGTFAWMSRNWSNWTEMADKTQLRGFLDADGDGSLTLKPQPVATAAKDWEGARRWNMGGVIPVFHTSPFISGGSNPRNQLDYTTGVDSRGGNYTVAVPFAAPGYRTALAAAAATPTAVQTTAPTLPTTPTVTLISAGNYRVAGRAASSGITGATAAVSGAIRQVKVKIGAGAFKSATMNLKNASGNKPTMAELKASGGISSGWYQDWTVDLTGSTSQTVTIVVEDTHLNTTTNTSLST